MAAEDGIRVDSPAAYGGDATGREKAPAKRRKPARAGRAVVVRDLRAERAARDAAASPLDGLHIDVIV